MNNIAQKSIELKIQIIRDFVLLFLGLYIHTHIYIYMSG